MSSFALLPLFNGYANDVSSYEAWALQMAAAGPAGIYRAGYFLDYPPGYLYALWLAGIVANAVGAGGVALRMIVETPALIADFVLALLIFIFVRRTAPARRIAAYVGDAAGGAQSRAPLRHHRVGPERLGA